MMNLSRFLTCAVATGALAALLSSVAAQPADAPRILSYAFSGAYLW